MFCYNARPAREHAQEMMNRAQVAQNEGDREFFRTQAAWWATQGHSAQERADDLLKEIELDYSETATVTIAYYIDHVNELLWIYFSEDDGDCEYYML